MSSKFRQHVGFLDKFREYLLENNIYYSPINIQSACYDIFSPEMQTLEDPEPDLGQL